MSRRAIATLAAAVTVLAGGIVAAPSPARAAGPLISQGRPATASSIENGGTPAANAVDGNPGTRWSSAFSDPQWIQVDLGADRRPIDQVVLTWEAAYATAFQIQISADGTDLDHHLHHHHRHRRHADPRRHRQRPLRADERHRPRHRLRLLALGVPGLRHDRRRRRNRRRGTTDLASSKPVAASSWEGGNAPAAAFDGRTTTRWSSQFSDPQWIQVDLGGTGHHQPGRAQLGGGVRARVPDRDLAQRRPPGPPSTPPPPAPAASQTLDRHRHRPLRADVRHRPRHRLRLLAVGVRGVRHRRHVDDHTRRCSPARPGRRAPPGSSRLSAPGRRRDGHHHPPARAVLGRGRRRGALPGLDQHQPHRLRLHRSPAT